MSLHRFESLEAFRLSHIYGWVGESGLGEGETLEIARQTMVRYRDDGAEYTSVWASYSLTTFPGSHAVGLSHGVLVTHHDMGLGQYFHKERLALAKEIGFKTLLCTVNADNDKEKHILGKNGWKKVHTMTDAQWIPPSSVELWVIDLTPEMG